MKRDPDKEKRLAEALRANLRKRKTGGNAADNADSERLEIPSDGPPGRN